MTAPKVTAPKVKAEKMYSRMGAEVKKTFLKIGDDEREVVTESGEPVPTDILPYIEGFRIDGDNYYVVDARDLELAKVRKNGGKFRLGEIMVESGQFIVGDPCFTARLPYDKVLDFVLETSAGEMLVPSGVDKEGCKHVGGTVVVSRTGIGDGIFPVYAHYKDGELTKVVIELNHGRWFTPEDEERQQKQETEAKPAV